MYLHHWQLMNVATGETEGLLDVIVTVGVGLTVTVTVASGLQTCR